MRKFVNLGAFSEERRAYLRESVGFGVYVLDLRQTTAEALARKSRGYSVEFLRKLCGRCVMFNGCYVDGVGRFRPTAEQFAKNELDEVSMGSFNPVILRAYSILQNNGVLSSDKYFCTKCGKKVDDISAHDCAAIPCERCGGKVDKKGARICFDCAKKAAFKIYGYHRRTNKNNPIFDRPEKRGKVLHIGAEIEIEGTRDFNIDASEERERIGGALGAACIDNVYSPLFEFETDASINYGVECISRPLTFDGWKKNADGVAALYKKAHELGGEFDIKNGLHFHVDRDFFYSESEEKRHGALVFMELLIYKYWDFFASISRRHANEFYYARKKDGVEGVITATRRVRDTGHTYAINAEGEYTVEFRFFGGSISNEREFFAALDIVQAVARWAKNANVIQATKATPSDIVKYLKDCANVREFVTNTRADGYDSETARKDRAEFIKALKKQEEKGGAL